MIRVKRIDEYGRQPLQAKSLEWDSYREAVSYIDYIVSVHRGM